MLHVGAERSGLLTYTDFPYIGMMLGPVPAGAYATWVGTARAAFDFGAVTLLACPVILWVFKQVADSAIAAAVSSLDASARVRRSSAPMAYPLRSAHGGLLPDFSARNGNVRIILSRNR
jgi:hypothetical protein